VVPLSSLDHNAASTETATAVTITFDPVWAGDAEPLLRLAREFHAEDGHPLDAAGAAALLQIIAGEPLARAWLLRRDGAAVGYVVITLGYSVEYGGRDGFIDDFYLATEARGEGLAAKFLDFALAQAALLGIGTLHLEAEVDNARATQLYRRAGFEETGRRLMRRRLRDHGP
jgi:ribosomal protein S18 acetylase RimI-like enzyme